MKHLKKAKFFWPLAAALLFGLLMELVFFQTDAVLLKIRGPETVALDLSAFSGYDGTGIPVLPEAGTYSFDGLSIPSETVTVTLSGTPQALRGLVSLCDEANAYKTAGAAHFLANPGGSFHSFTVRLKSHGNLSRLRIAFEEQAGAVTITSVVFNQKEIPFSWGRAVFFFAAFLLVFLIWKYELHREALNLDILSHRLLSLGAVLFCLGISFVLFYRSSPGHNFLTKLPSEAQLRSYNNEGQTDDAYAQQLDAFEKGHLSLDLAVNPELLKLDNVYDRGERDKKQVAYHWDRAFYKGSYYSYFGLTPLFTVYYPVYWLTGMLPSAALCLFILTAFAIVSIYFALNSLIRFFRLRPNLLLYLLGIPAVMGGGMLYMLQSNLNFYYYPVLSGLGWLAAFAAFSFYGCRSYDAAKSSGPYSPSSGGRKGIFHSLYFFFAGVSLVMIVMSRPNLLLLAMAFVLPAYLHILLDRQTDMGFRLTAMLPFLVPVLLGAGGICWYNYARFDSVFEFGTAYQLTESDIRSNGLNISFHHLKSMLYHYFAQPLKWKEFFPFLELSGDVCYDYGNYLYYECNAGLLSLPLNLGVFLLGWTCFSKSRTTPLKKPTYILLLVAALALGYVDFTMAGVHIRYVADLALVISILSLLLIFEHITLSNVKSGQILYAITVALLLATIVLGILLAFSNENFDLEKVNPDFFIRIARLLRSW